MTIETMHISVFENSTVSKVVKVRFRHSLFSWHKACRLVHIVPNVDPVIGPDEAIILTMLSCIDFLQKLSNLWVEVI